jgi:hypothetical protein
MVDAGVAAGSSQALLEARTSPEFLKFFTGTAGCTETTTC